MDATNAGMVSDRESGGAHASRTIQSADERELLAGVPADADAATYRDAIVEQNVLGKTTLNSWQRTHRFLRELYALDPNVFLFRALRDLWEANTEAQPLPAMLGALARDPSPRATSAGVLPIAKVALVSSLDMQTALSVWTSSTRSSRRFGASSWTRSRASGRRSRRMSWSPLFGGFVSRNPAARFGAPHVTAV